VREETSKPTTRGSSHEEQGKGAHGRKFDREYSQDAGGRQKMHGDASADGYLLLVMLNAANSECQGEGEATRPPESKKESGGCLRGGTGKRGSRRIEGVDLTTRRGKKRD